MKQRQKFWLKVFLWSAVIGGIVGYMGGRSHTYFPIQKINWPTTLSAQQAQQLQAVLQPYRGQSFWKVDLEEMRNRIQKLGWVRQSTVARQWPDTLTIKLITQKPVARWKTHALVNEMGDVYTLSNTQAWHDLVILEGEVTESKKILRALVSFQKILHPLHMTIQKLVLTPANTWQIYLLNGQVLLLGADTLMQAQKTLQHFVRAYPHIHKETLKFARKFDLRYSNGFVIQIKRSEPQTRDTAPLERSAQKGV